MQDLEMQKECKVAAFVTNGCWSLPQPASSEMADLWNTISGIPIASGGRDEIRWNHNNGLFTTAHCWEVIRAKATPLLYSEWIWKGPTIQRASHCLWQAVLSKLPTMDNLQKRGQHLASMCYFCKNNCEFSEHLFFECPYSNWIWKEILSRLDLHRSPKTLNLEIAELANNCPKKGPILKLVRVLLRTTVWHIWKQRCERIFQGDYVLKGNLLIQILEDSRHCIEFHEALTRLKRKRDISIFKRFNINCKAP